jgi:hypothetical protein
MTQPSKSETKAADTKGAAKTETKAADAKTDSKGFAKGDSDSGDAKVTDGGSGRDAQGQTAAQGHYARLGTTDPEDANLIRQVGYQEDESYVPDPFHQYGTLDTSDTAGGAHSRIQEISPVFDVARAKNLETAAAALDPNDPTPADLVVLPDEGNTVDAAKDRLDAAVTEVRDNPVEVGGPTEQQKLAAEGEGGDGDKAEEKPDSSKDESKSTKTA